MELDYFKDHLFDLLNESDILDVQDIQTDDKANTFQVTVNDGTKFDICCNLAEKF